MTASVTFCATLAAAGFTVTIPTPVATAFGIYGLTSLYTPQATSFNPSTRLPINDFCSYSPPLPNNYCVPKPSTLVDSY